MISSCTDPIAHRGARQPRRPYVPAAAAAAAFACAITGCDGGISAQIGSQAWGAIDVAVELRPPPPRPGRNEMVVIVSGEHHRPVYDALVSVRADATQPWVQAIEDGHVGVYRRAIVLHRGPAATVQVRLQRGDADTVLAFPVALAP